mgnify:CR=1 FL=1
MVRSIFVPVSPSGTGKTLSELMVAAFFSTMTLAAFGAVAAVLWFGGRMVMAGDLTVGELASFILYTLIVAMSLSALASLWSDFARARGAAERVFELLDREPVVDAGGGEKLLKVGETTPQGASDHLADRDPTSQHGRFLPGTQFGKRYRIVGLLGRGGMGEVYRARDARLGRDVALKVLPEEVAGDPKRRARFEREARLIGAVSHPNILSLFDVGETDAEAVETNFAGLERALEVASLLGAPMMRLASRCATEIPWWDPRFSTHHPILYTAPNGKTTAY